MKCSLILLLGATLAVASIGTEAMAMPMAPMADAAAPTPAPKLDAALRTLWHDHVVHTREYAFAVHDKDAAKAKQAADAVVTNAKQIAQAVGSFYGKAAGEQMLSLLAGHWSGVKALTDAIAAGDTAAQSSAMTSLNNNVNTIAGFLSGANPYLPKDAVQNLLATHVAHHAAQIADIMSGNQKGEQQTWAAMQHHMDVIADALAGALARQFPDKAK